MVNEKQAEVDDGRDSMKATSPHKTAPFVSPAINPAVGTQDSVKKHENPLLAWLSESTKALEKVSEKVSEPAYQVTSTIHAKMSEKAEEPSENGQSNPKTNAARQHQTALAEKPAEPSSEKGKFAPTIELGQQHQTAQVDNTAEPAMNWSEPCVEASVSSGSELYLTEHGMVSRKKNKTITLAASQKQPSRQLDQVDSNVIDGHDDAMAAFIECWVDQTVKFNFDTKTQKILQAGVEDSSNPHWKSDIDTLTGELLAPVDYPETMVDPAEHKTLNSSLRWGRETLTSAYVSDSHQNSITLEQESQESTAESLMEKEHISSVENKPSMQPKPASALQKTPESTTYSVSTNEPESDIYSASVPPVTGRRVWTSVKPQKGNTDSEKVQHVPGNKETSLSPPEATKHSDHITAELAQRQKHIAATSEPTAQPKNVKDQLKNARAATPRRRRGARRECIVNENMEPVEAAGRRRGRRRRRAGNKGKVWAPPNAILTPVTPIGWVDHANTTVSTVPATAPWPSLWTQGQSEDEIRDQSPEHVTPSRPFNVPMMTPSMRSTFLKTITAGPVVGAADPTGSPLPAGQVAGFLTRPTLVLRRMPPKIPCYMRAATQADMSQVTAIYNWEVENGLQALDSKTLLVSEFAKILDRVQHLNMPFIAVVEGSYPAPAGPSAVEASAETIVAFGFLWPWQTGLAGDTEAVGRLSAWLRLYVHPTYRDKRIGSCLLDTLTTLCSHNFSDQHSCTLANPDDDPVYDRALRPHTRAYHKLYIQFLVPNETFTRLAFDAGTMDHVLASPDRIERILANPGRKDQWLLSSNLKNSHLKSRNGQIECSLDSVVYEHMCQPEVAAQPEAAVTQSVGIEHRASGSGW